ncbi:hypothetical protein MMC08_003752 [Hypocenomyce scalaris]|nr:hypothetical protein [Hypocenomyce scalaris]
MFRPAVAIFHNLVCTDTASISINIEGRIYNALNAVLGDAARAVAAADPRSGSTSGQIGEVIVDPASTNHFGENIDMDTLIPNTPDTDSLKCGSGKSVVGDSITPAITLVTTRASRERRVEIYSSLPRATIHPIVDTYHVADAFNENTFDDAYESVKNMVYTYTWQRFNQRKMSQIGSNNSVGNTVV